MPQSSSFVVANRYSRKRDGLTWLLFVAVCQIKQALFSERISPIGDVADSASTVCVEIFVHELPKCLKSGL